jgi:hypothetical protein
MLEALIGFAFGVIFLRPVVVIVGVELVERYERWAWERWIRLHPEEYAALQDALRSTYTSSSLAAQLFA